LQRRIYQTNQFDEDTDDLLLILIVNAA